MCGLQRHWQSARWRYVSETLFHNNLLVCSKSLLNRAYAGGCVEPVFLLFSSVFSFFDRPVGVCASVNDRLSVVFFLSTTYLFVVTTWNAYGRCTKICILTLGYRKWGGKAKGWSPHCDIHDDLWRGDRFTKEPATKHHKERGAALLKMLPKLQWERTVHRIVLGFP